MYRNRESERWENAENFKETLMPLYTPNIYLLNEKDWKNFFHIYTILEHERNKVPLKNQTDDRMQVSVQEKIL